jgi:hypothetical protein
MREYRLLDRSQLAVFLVRELFSPTVHFGLRYLAALRRHSRQKT